MKRPDWRRLRFTRGGTPLRPATLLVALGGVATLLAVLVAVTWLPAQRRELASLHDAAANRALLLRRPAAEAVPRVPQPPDVRFRAAFPALESRPQRLEALLAAAAAERVSWSRADLRAEADSLPGIARYRVTLPVAGEYTAIRRFIGSALRGDPALALERLQLRRNGVAATQVEALTVWSIYTRNEAADVELAALAVTASGASR